jgi:hypothetical protein
MAPPKETADGNIQRSRNIGCAVAALVFAVAILAFVCSQVYQSSQPQPAPAVEGR